MEELRKLFEEEAQRILSELSDVLSKALKAPDEDLIKTAYRLVHTLKGAAGFVGEDRLVRTCHMYEDKFKLHQQTLDYDSFVRDLSKCMNEVEGLLGLGKVSGFRVDPETLDEILSLSEEAQTSLDAGNLTRARTLLNTLKGKVLSIRTSPMEEVYRKISSRFDDIVSRLGKLAILRTKGGDIRLETETLSKIEEALVHLVRNAIDHGIEPPDEREAKGKPRFGLIEVEAKSSEGFVKITVSDDGRGIDIDALVSKAKEMGLEYQDPYQLIFVHGLSTREEVGELSGRGVGMDVVLNIAKSLGGWVEVTSQKDKGTRFTVYILSNMWAVNYLLIRAMGYNLALNLDVVRRVFQVNNTLKKGGEVWVEVEEGLLPVVLYYQSPFGVVVGMDDKGFVVAADELFGVYQGPFQPMRSKDDLFVGMTYNEDGEVFAVLNLFKFLRTGA